MQLTGAEIIIECLLEQSVDTVFGYPGGAILNVYDALYQYSDKIKHVLTSHEQGASHAADGYARATGKVGVCLATSGPGATNLVTGIATACMDSVPVVAITCNVGTALLGKDSFQEVDIAGIVMPVTKHSYIVKDVTKLADTIRKAFIIAKSGRPGPVLVDVTKDVTAATYEYSVRRPATINREVETIRKEDLETAAQMIEEAKKLFFYISDDSYFPANYTAMDLAAAFLYQALGKAEREGVKQDNFDFSDTGAEDGMVRLFINIGKKQRVRPGDILGAVAGESGMPGDLVGAIDMFDSYTFVEVPREYGAAVLKAMKNAKIKGKSINVEPANAK